MSISRRYFLLFSGSILATAGTSFSIPNTKRQHQLVAKTLDTQTGVGLSQMHYSTFETLKDQTLHVLTERGERLRLQLDQVEDQGRSDQLEQFSLTFRGKQGQLLDQGTYQFEHPQLGQFNLFIVPSGQSKHNAYYQATFSHLIA
ncbi:hypothetical protein [Acaryochloris sp. IP29b_bin.137]|uniref:DUF6916 family protein n=1 Tax=Acaryochloris sp. IP29b_bin.137 TaxID=2969217 RepID=UPI002621B74A|nr:hypothetical protein [Acaryochloris sp. IP29b_bin.137]